MDSQKGHYLELQWGQHLALMRGCQREQNWALPLVDCLGCHWDCYWVTGWVLLWEIDLDSRKVLHWELH